MKQRYNIFPNWDCADRFIETINEYDPNAIDQWSCVSASLTSEEVLILSLSFADLEFVKIPT